MFTNHTDCRCGHDSVPDPVDRADQNFADGIVTKIFHVASHGVVVSSAGGKRTGIPATTGYMALHAVQCKELASSLCLNSPLHSGQASICTKLRGSIVSMAQN
jgi:hypothetical protein